MAKKSATKVLNYRVIVEKEHYNDGTVVYSASCPTLGVFDYGSTLDETLASIRDGIDGVIAFLTKEGQDIPTDAIDESTVTFTKVRVPLKSARLAGV